MARTLHISQAEINKQSQQILLPVKNGENAVGMCYPGCKIDYNVTSFINKPAVLNSILKKYAKRVVLPTIYLDCQETVKTFTHKLISALQSELKNKVPVYSLEEAFNLILDEGYDLYLFVFNAHVVKLAQLNEILTKLHSLIIVSHRINAAIFFEANINKPGLSQILQQNHKFLQNVQVFPVYSYSESVNFLFNLAKDWQFKLSKQLTIKIALQCGGSLWLLREVLRQIKDNSTTNLKEVFESPAIKLRLETIFNLLTNEEQDALADLCYGNKTQVKPLHLSYFLNIGLVKKNKQQQYELTLPALDQYLKTNFASQQLQLETGKVIYQKQNISNHFTNLELETLVLLLKNKDNIVAREQLAQTIWRESWADKYSDWAIDKHISRIRKILSSLGLPRNLLKTKKGQGFLI